MSALAALKRWRQPSADDDAPAPVGRRRRKTPTILQLEAVECGAAALAMILAYHGRWVPLEALRIDCGVTRDGTKALNLVKAARRHGLVAKGFTREPDDLRGMTLPMIVFWNFNHFVVLEGFGKNMVYINDPADGPRVLTDEDFDRGFTGVVLTFERGPEFREEGKPPSVARALKERFVGLKEAVGFLILIGLALVLPGLVLPAFSTVFVDQILMAGMQDWLMPLLTGLLATTFLRVVLSWMEVHYLLRIQTKLALASSSKFLWHVLRLPVEFYTQRSPAEIGSRLGINDQVAGMLTGQFASAMLAVMKALFFGAMMFFYNTTLALINVAVVACDIVLLKIIAERSRVASQKVAVDSGKLMNTSTNGLTIIESIKACGAESAFFSRWAGFEAKFVNAEQDEARTGLVLGTFPALLSALSSSLMLCVGGMMIMRGEMSIGMLVAFQTLAASFTGPAHALVDMGKTMLHAQGDMNRLDDVMRYPLAPCHRDVPAQEAEQDTRPLEGKIEMRGVTFGYSRTEEPLLEDFDLVIRPSERIAIVGASGCGKSTISRLVMGLYEPWRGSITFDGKPRNTYTRHQFASMVAMVDQDIVLFEGSIRDNITMWDRSISDQDIIQAAKDACIHDVIVARPGGYRALISEGGANLSGGQRQRIEIARALVTNPRILVMDEATSALSSELEHRIDANLRRRGCTCLIIAHRLSTIRDADSILVMSQGSVVERGRHEDLMAIENGFYRQLVAVH